MERRPGADDDIRFWACDACRHHRLNPAKPTKQHPYTKTMSEPLSWWDRNGHEDLLASLRNQRPPPRIPHEPVLYPHVRLGAKIAGCQTLTTSRHRNILQPLVTQVDQLKQLHPALNHNFASEPLQRHHSTTRSVSTTGGRRERLHARLNCSMSNVLASASRR
eukprot:TRINITY_DN12507_c0_g1_i1.p2 TRINITY_DN12507_c0_g1~~TRINITY_DN12507_c0_g1_i1.p2  ORF type:complete len:163 (+),score=5.81 TRINITY_DN12507_c0_g1_i1:1769-2257(+)